MRVTPAYSGYANYANYSNANRRQLHSTPNQNLAFGCNKTVNTIGSILIGGVLAIQGIGLIVDNARSKAETATSKSCGLEKAPLLNPEFYPRDEQPIVRQLQECRRSDRALECFEELAEICAKNTRNIR